MFKEFIDSSLSLAKSLKTNPATTIMGIVLMLAIVGAYNALNNSAKIDAMAAPTPAQEQHMLDASFDADALINKELSDLRADTGAARALVRQFTNGNHNLAGIPYAFIVTTHVDIQEGVSAPSFDRYPTSSMNNTLRQMFKGDRCIIQETEDMRRDAAYIDYLEKHGVVKSFSCPLISKDGIPMGVVGVGYLDPKNQVLDDDQTLAAVQSTTEAISRHLHTVRYGEEDTTKGWW